eukprot:SAG31_NODE_6509_length_1992_cov_0.970417_1_plen_63_part_10
MCIQLMQQEQLSLWESIFLKKTKHNTCTAVSSCQLNTQAAACTAGTHCVTAHCMMAGARGRAR